MAGRMENRKDENEEQLRILFFKAAREERK
jgi:hypothetical protein